MVKRNCIALFLLWAAPFALGWADGLDRQEAHESIACIAEEQIGRLRGESMGAATKQEIHIAPHTLRWKESVCGKRGPDGWALWISLHGGGEVPPPVNDEQWNKQATLYRPDDGIYLAPRAPTDTWFLWQEPHVDALLEQLIDIMITTRAVDPDRIYLLGYSAGGNGVYHLASRMADRFAAAAAMAGYPTKAPQPSLRNLPFAILVGEHDTTFDRMKEARAWEESFARHRAEDSGGYRSFLRIYPGLGHWMENKDAEALPWMAQFRRDPWPKRIIWVQDEVLKSRFYWLEIPQEVAKPGMRVTVYVDGQTITLDGELPSKVTLWLSDSLLDLDKQVRVVRGNHVVFEGKVERTENAIRRSLQARPDRSACATAVLSLELPSAKLPSSR